MSALADLQAAQTAVQTAVTAAITDIQTLAAQVAGFGDSVTSADAETVANALNTLATNLSNAVNQPVVQPAQSPPTS